MFNTLAGIMALPSDIEPPPSSVITVVIGAGGSCGSGGGNSEIQDRIARKDAANEALVQRVFALEAKLEATMADMRSIARARDNYQAEAQRLSALAIQLQTELAQRMALPANALNHSRT